MTWQEFLEKEKIYIELKVKKKKKTDTETEIQAIICTSNLYKRAQYFIVKKEAHISLNDIVNDSSKYHKLMQTCFRKLSAL